MIIKGFNTRERILIIAELSANHNGSLELAIESIKGAKRAGADAIKLQTYTADTITLNSDKNDFIINGTIWNGKKMYDLYKDAYTPWEWHEELFRVAHSEGLICFSSPFDKSAVDFLDNLNAPAFKIASFEITDIPLIEYTASKGKPIILSTGISTLEDIQLAVDTCRNVGNHNIGLLKCTSSYPAPINEANLSMIRDFQQKFDITPGLSDHTIGNVVPIVASVLGARIIEKHFILDRSLGGPDSSFSMNEEEFREMVIAVRQAEESLGEVNYNLTKKQISGRNFSRSLYITKKVKKGDILTIENIRSIRPGYGMHPKYLKEILGKRFNADFDFGTPLSKEMIVE